MKQRIREAIVVEGRYDKNALAQLVDTVLVETSGFRIFREPGKLDYLRRLAEARGLIILTDSDGAGFVIRNYLKGAIRPAGLKHAYIPDRYGKERRKRRPGKEGKLGVEGMPPDVLEEALRRAGATFLDEKTPEWEHRLVTKADLFAAGLSGSPAAAEKRQILLQKLHLPAHLTTNGLLDAINSFYGYEGFRKLGFLPPDIKASGG